MNLENAVRLAAIYHSSQKDKTGRTYLLHPLRVMISLGLDATDTERCVAVLHDTLEDTECTEEILREEGFSEEIITAVVLLTKIKGEDEDERFNKIMDNPISKKVKIKDIEDNMDPKRMKNKRNLQDKDFERFKKYMKRYQQLTGT